MANACGRGQLILRPVAFEHLAYFEQRQIGKTAINVCLNRSDQARQQARPHVGLIRRNRISEREFASAAAEQFGRGLCNERPGHRLDHAARPERALGGAGALLDRGEHRLARRVAAFERRHRHLVNADNAHDLLDDIGLAVHVGPPGGHRDLHHRAAAGDHEAEMAENPFHLRKRHVDAGEPPDFGERKINHAIVAEGLADHDIFGWRAAARLHDQPGGHFEPRHHEGRIDAALETVARVRIDAELAAGLGDVDLVPQRRFDQHV